ncbi:MAG: YccF domain-containing protein [Firmicutes bacterium]|nr:YccF domain-containing protein [Bacillota bacterium]
MSLIGNLIWIILGGLISAIGWTIAGALLCITVIGIPFGVQCFKIAGLTLAPFGRDVQVGNFGAGGLIGNIIWLLVLGWELFLMHLTIAFLLAITIIGLPFAKQHLKLAQLALIPFGARI